LHRQRGKTTDRIQVRALVCGFDQSPGETGTVEGSELESLPIILEDFND